jgi:hypothetical protein
VTDPSATNAVQQLLRVRSGVEARRRWCPRLTIQWPVEMRPGADGTSEFQLGMLTNQRSPSWAEFFRTDLASTDPAVLAPADRIRAAVAVVGFVQSLHACDVVCGNLEPHRFLLADLATGVEVMTLFDSTCRPVGCFPGGTLQAFDLETDRAGLAALMWRLLATASVNGPVSHHLTAGAPALLERLLSEGAREDICAPRPEEWLVALGAPIPAVAGTAELGTG